MNLRHHRLTALAAVLGGLVAGTASGHPTPYGDTYTFSAENFPNSFGVVKEPEHGDILTFPGNPYTLTFDGIAETAGEMIVNERAVVWPGKTGIIARQDATIDGQTEFELTDWYNAGEVLEFSFDTVDGQWVSNDPQANSGYSLKGIDWLHAAAGDSPEFFRTGFYFYWTNNGVPISNMSFTIPELGVLVGPHPFDPSVPEVAYIAYGGGQVDAVSDPYVGGTDLHAGTRQLDENASWALLQAVLSVPPASGNGFRAGYLVDIDTVIDATSGDFNNDGNVDTSDYDILRGNFQQAGGFTDGDINFDGTVNLSDFVDFKKSYQLANGQPLSSVPEPGTLALAAIVLAGAGAYRSRFAVRKALLGLGLLGCVAAQASIASAQGEYLWVPPGPTAANWNLNSSWNPALVPSQEAALGAAEFGIINNGGRAFVDANLPNGTDDISGLTLGRDAGHSGALEIRSGGSLAVIRSADGNNGTAQIGGAGTGVLDVLPGGNFAAYALNLGGVNSQINASGNSSVVVETAANLAQTTKISGPSVNFTAASLTMTGTLVADITSGAHSPIVVSGKANLIQPTLKVQFTGHTPAYGDEFALVDAGTLSGKFATIDTSAAPALDLGLEYRLAYGDDASVNLKVDNTLVLAVDPDTGASNITNLIGASISLDGYSILSAGGHLANTWAGLRASDSDWLAASPTVNALSELNLSGVTAVNLNASLSLGTILAGPLAVANRDLVFEYTANGELRHGLVTYEPIINPVGQPGDTDNDGDVDLDDLNAVRNNFGASGPVGGTPGDAYPFDGSVNLDDLNGVRNNFGAVSGGSAAVPEPTTWALGALGALALAGVARKRQ